MMDVASLCYLALATAGFTGVASFFPRRRRTRVAAARPRTTARAVPVIPFIELDEDGDPSEEAPPSSGVALRGISYDADALADAPSGKISAFAIEAAGSTDRGLRRKQNEDRLLMLEDEHVFVVADGMGGHAGGAIASELAVAAIAESVGQEAQRTNDVHDARVPRAAAELVRAVAAANEAVRRTADADDRLADMGTTVVAARFCPRKDRLYVTHVGDSRCYRLRDGRLRQVTLDHTMDALGVTGPSAHHLTRAVGTRDQVEPDIAVLKPQLGDAYVLCSDGLTKMMSDEEIAAVLSSSHDVAHVADELVRMANVQGGNDNVTAIVVRVVPKAKVAA